MLMSKRRAVVGVIIAMIAIAALFPVGPYRERNTYRCDVCFAKRDVFRWWFGSWGTFAFPISGRSEVISETKFGERFLPDHKKHLWSFAQGSPYYWGARWGGCALGSGRHLGQAFPMYEDSEEFRTFIENKITAGKLTPAKVVSILSDRSRGKGAENSEDLALVNEFFDSTK